MLTSPVLKPGKSPKRKIRFSFVIGATLALVSVIILLVPFGFGFRSMWTATHIECVHYAKTLADYGLTARDVRIPARWGGSYAGYFIPGTLDATIILAPTGNGARDTTLQIGAILAKHGYSVLTFDSRRCVNKIISLGYREVEDVEDAFDYLKRNPDKLPVSLAHVGLYGLSTAGATVTMAAAQMPEVGATVAVGNYAVLSDIAPSTAPHDILEAMTGLAVRLGYWVSTGEDAANLNPLAAIPKIMPRSVLLIYGSIEESLGGAKRQLAAARAADPQWATDYSSELWIVAGADHGEYLNVVSEAEYARHLLPFFDCALLKQSCAQYQALWQPESPSAFF